MSIEIKKTDLAASAYIETKQQEARKKSTTEESEREIVSLNHLSKLFRETTEIINNTPIMNLERLELIKNKLENAMMDIQQEGVKGLESAQRLADKMLAFEESLFVQPKKEAE